MLQPFPTTSQTFFCVVAYNPRPASSSSNVVQPEVKAKPEVKVKRAEGGILAKPGGNPQLEPPAPHRPDGGKASKSASVVQPVQIRPVQIRPVQPVQIRPVACKPQVPSQTIGVLPDILENFCWEQLFGFWGHVENKFSNTLINVYGT
jgi:hypothetical protein